MKPRKQRMERDGSVPPLRQLKLRPKADREWAYALSKQMTSQEARGEIRERLGISLGSDDSYSQFLSWQFHQQRLENYNQMLEQFEEFYKKSNPNASREKVRDVGIAFFMAEATANNDREAFTDVANLSLREEEGKTRAELEKQKIGLRERKIIIDEAKAKVNQAVEESARKMNLTPEAKRELLEAIDKKLLGA